MGRGFRGTGAPVDVSFAYDMIVMVQLGASDGNEAAAVLGNSFGDGR
jgi:hypothetical protein